MSGLPWVNTSRHKWPASGPPGSRLPNPLDSAPLDKSGIDPLTLAQNLPVCPIPSSSALRLSFTTSIAPAACVLACVFAWPATSSATGLENGEVQANAQFLSGGVTTTADLLLEMEVRSPDLTQLPPPPNAAFALANIEATMASITHRTTAATSSALNQFNSAAQSLVEYVDNLVVNAEGVSTGTELIVTVAWDVSGRAEFNAPDRIFSRSRLLVNAAGLDLDPDPNAPDPPRQQWSRDATNYDGEVLDPFGRVTFDFLVQAGTPDPGNIRLRTATGVLVGDAGSIFTGNYDSDATSELILTLVGAVEVRTTSGRPLYRWETNAHSGLDYGSRDEDPPLPPPLSVGNSPHGNEFARLSWQSSGNYYYQVEVTSDGSGWSLLSEVRGNDDLIEIDVIRNPRVIGYRLLEFFGSESSDYSVRSPLLHVIRKDGNAGKVRVAWNTHQQEVYQLNEILGDGSLSPVFAAVGDGSAVWFDFDPVGPRRLFQVSAFEN